MRHRSFGELILFGIMVIVVGCMTFPLVWMTYSSMKDNREIFTTPWSLPTTFSTDMFVRAWWEGRLGTYLFNSSMVTVMTVVGTLILASMAAFAFTRLRFSGRDLFFYLFLAGLVIPPQTFVIPLFVMLRRIGILDTRLALIVPYIASGLPLAIFILHAFFSTLPRELDEAATIDGCGYFTIYWRIILPIAKPALATVAVFTALSAWNEFLFAMLFVRDPALRTLPIGLYVFYGHYDINYQMLFSGLTIATLPLLVFYAFFHRYIMEGLTLGALKG